MSKAMSQMVSYFSFQQLPLTHLPPHDEVASERCCEEQSDDGEEVEGDDGFILSRLAFC
jgi:hypothetical protein